MFSYTKIVSKVSTLIAIALLIQLIMLPGGLRVQAADVTGMEAGDVETAQQLTVNALDFDYRITDFEAGDDGWEYSFGEQPASAIQGSLEIIQLQDAYEGEHVAKLSADFTKSAKDKAAYTAMRKDINGLELGKYAFWVKTSDLLAIRIRTTDSTGQVFQQKINLLDTTDWQQVIVDPITSSQYWGGAANGKWNAPAQKIALMIDRNDIKNGQSTASMLVDEVAAELDLPELAVKQTVMGNIYLDSAPPVFQITAQFPEVAWQVYNLNGALVDSGTVSIASNGQGSFPLPNLKLGYYTLELSAQAVGQAPVRLKTPFALLSDYDWDSVEDSPFGIAAHLHRESFGWSGDLTRLIKYAGAKTARGGYEWSIEKSLGQYTFTPQPEKFMSYVEADGLKSMFVSGYNHPLYDDNKTPYTDAGRTGFANYVDAYIEHFKDQLVGVQVYNEFNGGFGKRGNSPADSKPDYYYKLLKATYEKVKENHPDFVVSGMVTAGVDLDWIEEVLKLGGMKYLDNIAVHPYRYGRAVLKDREPEGMAAELQQLKDLIREYNEGELKPIWISEFGWPTHQASNGTDEKTQADFLARAYVIALSEGVERIVWYNLMNDGLQADYNEHNFGLVRFKDDPLGAHTPKPSYVAYAAMTRELTNAEFVEEETYGGDIKSFLFDQDGEPLRAVWATENTNAVILTNEPLQITDMTGNTEQFVPVNGKVYVTLNGELIYVKGNINGIAEDSTFAITGEESFIGDETGFTVQINNEHADHELNIALEVEGSSNIISVAKGELAAERITIASTRDTTFRSAVITITSEGKAVGRLRHAISASEAKQVKVKPSLALREDGGFDQSLQLEIENLGRVKPLAAVTASWSVGDQTGTQRLEGNIMPGETGKYDLALGTFPMGTDLPAVIQIEFESGMPYQFSGNLSFNPIMYGDGTAVSKDEANREKRTATIDLSSGKKILQSGHSGTIDVTGNIWLEYDKDNLYLLAELEDDIHAVPSSGGDIWNNDGIQFAIVSGVPGESKGWYEFGIADSPEGAHVHRWSNLKGKVSEHVQLAKAEVIREEADKRTVYKLALPWQEIEPIKPERGGVISFSILVNDNDGNGRRGWVEWGSGIGAEKRASLFRSMQWIHETREPIAEESEWKTSEGKEIAGRLAAKHGEGTVLRYELVQDGQLGKASIDEQAGTFVYTPNKGVSGEDHFTFRVHDGFGYSNIATVSVQIVKSQVVFPGGTSAPSEYISTDGKLDLPAGAAGKLSLEDDIELLFPAGTTEQSARFTVVERDSNQIKLPQQAIAAFSPMYQLSQSNETALKQPIRVSVGVDETLLKQDEKAVLFAYDSVSNSWTALDTAMEGGRLVAHLSDLTVAVMALIVPANANLGGTDGTDGEGADSVEFVDIADHWANAAIQEAAQKGLMKGFPDGSFQPNKALTRAEFAVMLARVLQLPAKTNTDVGAAIPFTDDQQIPSWARNAVYSAAQLGLLHGYSDGSFAGQKVITRSELAVMTNRTLQFIINNRDADRESTVSAISTGAYEKGELSGKQLDEVDHLLSFVDAGSIPSWAKSAVQSAFEAGLLQGRNGNRFAPAAGTTRAEAAVLLLRLLKY